MITEHDLQEAIAECEGVRHPTSSICMKLAAFYTIQDHLYPMENVQAYSDEQYSYSNEPSYDDESKFVVAGQRIDAVRMAEILDELMQTLEVLHPKLYDAVLRKLKA